MTETPQKTRDTSEDQRYLRRLETSLGNPRVDETNVDSTQGGYSQTSSVNMFHASVLRMPFDVGVQKDDSYTLNGVCV